MKVFSLPILTILLLLNFPSMAQQNSGSMTDKVKEFFKSEEQKKKEVEARRKSEEKERNEKARQNEQNKNNCQFNLAQIKVTAYLKNRFKIIETYTPQYFYGAIDFSRMEMHCSVNYRYLVRERIYNPTAGGNGYSELIYELNISLVKYDSGYEITSATLLDRNKRKLRTLI